MLWSTLVGVYWSRLPLLHYGALSDASWKMHFFFLRAHDSKRTRGRMSEWLEKTFDCSLELVSADGERAVTDGNFVIYERQDAVLLQTDTHFSVTSNFFPTRIALHAKSKADGRKVCLVEVAAPSMDDQTPEDIAAGRLDISARTLPRALQHVALWLTLHHKQGWARPTRGRPRPTFHQLWGIQGEIQADGITDRWEDHYSLIGDLFTALHPGLPALTAKKREARRAELARRFGVPYTPRS